MGDRRDGVDKVIYCVLRCSHFELCTGLGKEGDGLEQVMGERLHLQQSAQENPIFGV